MKDIGSRNFGFLIAYLIPGFAVVLSVVDWDKIVVDGLGRATPTVGGFLYVTLFAVTAGMFLGAIRWLLLDRVHQATGIRRPSWDFAKLIRTRAAFVLLAESHYRYYEFFGHMVFALIVVAIAPTNSALTLGLPSQVIRVAAVCLAVLSYFASRDALRNYYQRGSQLLSSKPA